MTTDPHSDEDTRAAVAEYDGLEEISLKDGPGGLRVKRFAGRYLAEAREVAKTGFEVTRVYRSRKGKFVIQRQQSDWSDLSTMATLAADWKNEWKNWRGLLGGAGDRNWGDFTVEIVDSLDDLRPAVAPKLYRRVVAAVEQPRAEDLDI
ncbi:EXLDI family protein [Nocardia transvalensis]|uniref:EXLDI family protein n=1 Tax=Nocardia transvalensis TaxID=37333 RepID=A0A7W9UHA8_9NOCA|nr:EXLDI protein [Nocardia transvalensis]MBB5912932.1 EXLDI family protein [Nocardia transvalensis]